MCRVAGCITVKWPLRWTATTASHSSSLMLKIIRSLEDARAAHHDVEVAEGGERSLHDGAAAGHRGHAVGAGHRLPARGLISFTTASAGALEGSRPSTLTP